MQEIPWVAQPTRVDEQASSRDEDAGRNVPSGNSAGATGTPMSMRNSAIWSVSGSSRIGIIADRPASG